MNGCRPTFYVGGQSVEYVNEWSHLGHIISANCDDKIVTSLVTRCVVRLIMFYVTLENARHSQLSGRS